MRHAEVWSITMNAPSIAPLTSTLAVIQAAGVPALRVVFTLAFAAFVVVGLFIYRKRHQLFDRDPDVDNDFVAVRDVRIENIVFVWPALTIVMFCICVAAWRA
jgi:hypothetical protein